LAACFEKAHTKKNGGDFEAFPLDFTHFLPGLSARSIGKASNPA